MTNILGVDLGNVVVSKRKEGEKPFEALPVENAFETLARLVKNFDNTYIISRVNSEQRIRSLIWLDDQNSYNITSIPKENVYYCFDRRDKAIFVEGLRIGVFIDDRPNVLTPMKDHVMKILFNPYEGDLVKYKNEIDNMKNLFTARNWKEVEEILCVKTINW